MNPNNKFQWTQKGWGGETTIFNSKEQNLCFKKLYLMAGKSCSVHVHLQKEEYFFIQSGYLHLEYIHPENWDHKLLSNLEKLKEEISSGIPSIGLRKANQIKLMPNYLFFVPKYMIHRFTGLQDTIFWEVSTFHTEEDSIRIIKGD